MTTQQLIGQLIENGGAIVSSNDCSEIEIADAQATGRFAVDDDGMGFVIRYKEWLAKTASDHAQIVAFTKHLGAPTFQEAFDVLIRTKGQDEAKIEEMFNRIKAMGAERVWQPIETAPKDGTYIIALLPHGRSPLSRLRGVSYWTAERAAAEDGGSPDDYQEGWYDDEESEWAPSFWIPFPDSSNAGGEQRP